MSNKKTQGPGLFLFGRSCSLQDAGYPKITTMGYLHEFHKPFDAGFYRRFRIDRRILLFEIFTPPLSTSGQYAALLNAAKQLCQEN